MVYLGLANSLIHGQKTVAAAATPEALTSTPTTPLKTGLWVHNLATATVYLGNSASVTNSTGFPLAPGDRMFLGIVDPAYVFVRVATDGHKVAYLGA